MSLYETTFVRKFQPKIVFILKLLGLLATPCLVALHQCYASACDW